MAEQAHARFYRDLPAVVRHPLRRWLIVGALVVVGVLAIAVPVYALAYATHALPSSWWGGGGRTVGGRASVFFDAHLFRGICVAFIVGGALGFAYARRWWSALALYVAGFAVWLWLGPAGVVPWLFWIFGVSAGAGVHGLLERRRVVRASFLNRPR